MHAAQSQFSCNKSHAPWTTAGHLSYCGQHICVNDGLHTQPLLPSSACIGPGSASSCKLAVAHADVADSSYRPRSTDTKVDRPWSESYTGPWYPGIVRVRPTPASTSYRSSTTGPPRAVPRAGNTATDNRPLPLYERQHSGAHDTEHDNPACPLRPLPRRHSFSRLHPRHLKLYTGALQLSEHITALPSPRTLHQPQPQPPSHIQSRSTQTSNTHSDSLSPTCTGPTSLPHHPLIN